MLEKLYNCESLALQGGGEVRRHKEVRREQFKEFSGFLSSVSWRLTF